MPMIVSAKPPASPVRSSGEFRNHYAFAALKADGSVVTWGAPYGGGDSSAVASQLRSDVTQIFSTRSAFAALKADGSVVSWGDDYFGGDSSAVASQLRSGVTQIFSTQSAFAALKADGSVVSWGDPYEGGDSSAVASQLLSDVSQIFSTYDVFAALKADGSVVTWGSSGSGGDSSVVAIQLRSGVSQIFSTGSAFAALKADGSVVTWGFYVEGGTLASQLRSDVTQIFSTDGAFAALKTDGSVVTWGADRWGGDSSAVASQLRSGVTQIFSHKRAFAALKADGSVVTWGKQGYVFHYGGDSSAVADHLRSGVTKIFSTHSAFAALKADGSVVTWGDDDFGGDSSAVASQLRSGVTQIFSNERAFAALKADGSVVTWGSSDRGGNSSSVSSRLTSGVTQIFSTWFAFAALKDDGSVVTWGDDYFGGDSSAVASQLRSGVVGFANPFTDDWLVGDPTPSISLALAPALVSEDGGANLIYTFSRTGDASNALTVSYGIAGTADGSDYSGASPASGQSITFSPGQSTVTLSLDPTADSSSEADETVALTLFPGSGYTVGTTTAVIGTISNDDFPSTLPENTSTASPIQLSASLISGDTPASTTISLSGPDAAAFVVEGAALFLKAGVALDYETKANYAVTVSVSDGNRPDAPPVTTAYNLSVSDVNEAPTALAFNNITSTLPETRSTANRVRVADIAITDDALGTNSVTLSGADAASFEVEGTALFLKAGTRLSHETKPSYSVNVSAADPSLPGSTGPSAAFTLAIGNSIPVTIFNADLSPGTDLSILSTLDLDDAGLASLAALGIQHNATGIDFQLTCHPDQDKAQVSAALDLVAEDLLPQLSDASGRRTTRKLLFYGLHATGAITPLTYDPITGAGARFYDLNNDGRADLLTLGLIDGGPGDKDGERNGLIADPSFAAFVDLTHLQFITNGSNTLTVSDPTNAAPAALQLQATLTGRPNSSNEIGYVVLDPSEVARSESLLNDPAWLRQRAQTLFSSLENTDVTLPSGTTFNRDFGLINGQSLRFFEIQDASLQQLLSLIDPRFRWLTPATVGEPNLSDPQVEFNSSSGVRFALRFLPSDPGLDSLISQSQGLAPVLDLSAFNASQNLSGTVALGREAAFNSSVGFYRTLDAMGTVIAVDGITRLRPGESGYAAAALLPAHRVAPLSGLSVTNGQTTSRTFNGISGATFLAPFAEVNGNTFFAFGAANPDGISHFRTLGNNLFGLEDFPGGGDQDYDDLVIGFTFTGIG